LTYSCDEVLTYSYTVYYDPYYTVDLMTYSCDVFTYSYTVVITLVSSTGFAIAYYIYAKTYS